MRPSGVHSLIILWLFPFGVMPKNWAGCVYLGSDRQICCYKNAIPNQPAQVIRDNFFSEEPIKQAWRTRGFCKHNRANSSQILSTTVSSSELLMDNEHLSARWQISFQWSQFQHIWHGLSTHCKHQAAGKEISKRWGQQDNYGAAHLISWKRLITVFNEQTNGQNFSLPRQQV